jgi:two-component system, sensor histidine kinase and response regulator
MADRPTVLIVDDDPRNRRLLAAILAPRHEVLEAGAGEQALAAVAASSVDIVLLDVMMPGMDGLETCRRLKALQGAFLPVVLVTALSSQADRNAGLAAGADDFITKPIDRVEVGLRVANLLRLRAQEAQISRQLEQLRALQALKDDLFTLVVHDVRNPLTGVTGYLGLLDAHVNGPQGLVLVASALEAAQRVEALLGDVLEIRRLEEATGAVRRDRTPLGELLEAAARTVEGAAARQQVVVERRDEVGRPVALDARLVRRALENLLVNAVRFSRAGGQVVLSARAEPGRVVLTVADRGPGVAEAIKPRLFEKYRTDDSRATTRRHGFGLGLHLVKLVAEVHGGEAFVRDRAEGGAELGLWVAEPVA